LPGLVIGRPSDTGQCHLPDRLIPFSVLAQHECQESRVAGCIRPDACFFEDAFGYWLITSIVETMGLQEPETTLKPMFSTPSVTVVV
jgi:hypothetical protein